MGAGDGKVCAEVADEFQDFLPIMAQKLSEQEFLEELCNGFRLLADPRSGTITFASLKKNARWLGLEGMTDSELKAMIQEGDADGDGALNEHEFCVLMIRTSPTLLSQAQNWLDDALEAELADYMDTDDLYGVRRM
eukprot:TRINITY_DN20688_c0_g1_i1.p1 TRINITY_DN20688_c0_g1~~TRINITY_DN20688_c0_g1_i1.p1  ORF type:complete len:136 (+),score=27.04 TRINITY_DN20688_c0_g1_i1:411-818(+)